MPPPGRRSAPPSGPPRRRVLRAGASLLGALGIGGALGWTRWRNHPRPPARGGGPGAPLPFLTPTENFYRYSNGPPPSPLSPEAASLRLGSGQGVAIPWSELLPLADRVEVRTLECDGNGYLGGASPAGCQIVPDEGRGHPAPENWPWRFGGIGTAEWRVISVKDLFDRLGRERRGPWLRVEGRDGYVRWFPAEAAAQPDFVLAVGMNGALLPHGHGGPARLLAPGQYGAMQVKWVQSLRFGEHDDARPFDGGPETWYPIKPLAFASTPRDGAEIEGLVELAGAAFAGARPVKEVLLWMDPAEVWTAELVDPPRANVWSRWRSRVRLPPGEHVLRIACVDDRGRHSREQAAWGDAEGYGGFHDLRIRVR